MKEEKRLRKNTKKKEKRNRERTRGLFVGKADQIIGITLTNIQDISHKTCEGYG